MKKTLFVFIFIAQIVSANSDQKFITEKSTLDIIEKYKSSKSISESAMDEIYNNLEKVNEKALNEKKQNVWLNLLIEIGYLALKFDKSLNASDYLGPISKKRKKHFNKLLNTKTPQQIELIERSIMLYFQEQKFGH